MDIILDRLIGIGKDLGKGIDSRYKDLGDMLLPLSMAIVTDYNEQYLGVKGKEKPKPKKAAQVGTSFTGSSAPAGAKKPVAAEPKESGEKKGKDEACASCTESESACATCNLKTITLGGGK